MLWAGHPLVLVWDWEWPTPTVIVTSRLHIFYTDYMSKNRSSDLYLRTFSGRKGESMLYLLFRYTEVPWSKVTFFSNVTSNVLFFFF